MSNQSHGNATYGIASAGNGTILIPLLASRDVLRANVTQQMLGIFGQGKVETILADKTFTVPANVSRLRVTCIGGGGGGATNDNVGGNGGTTSFGAICSASGGTGGTTISFGGTGGVGQIGDLLTAGGDGGDHRNYSRSGAGGGGVGTPLGNGGKGVGSATHYEGVPQFDSMTFNPFMAGLFSTGGAAGNVNADTMNTQLHLPGPAAFPFFYHLAWAGDYLTALRPTPMDVGRPGPLPLCGGDGGGGHSAWSGAGGGGGGYLSGGFPGCGRDTVDRAGWGGNGGLGGGGGGGAGRGNVNGGDRGRSGAGGGCAVTVATVTPGQNFTVTVGIGGVGGIMGGTLRGGTGGAGCVIVEY